MSNWTEMWKFETARFRVVWSVTPSAYPDLSWADEQTVENIENGFWVVFDSRVHVECDGIELGADYLGESVYRDVEDFRTDGGYFHGMVREACHAARRALVKLPRLDERAAS